MPNTKQTLIAVGVFVTAVRYIYAFYSGIYCQKCGCDVTVSFLCMEHVYVSVHVRLLVH